MLLSIIAHELLQCNIGINNDVVTQHVSPKNFAKNLRPDISNQHWQFPESYKSGELQTLIASLQSNNILPLQFQLGKYGKRDIYPNFAQSRLRIFVYNIFPTFTIGVYKLTPRNSINPFTVEVFFCRLRQTD